jgi:hypothetical protein
LEKRLSQLEGGLGFWNIMPKLRNEDLNYLSGEETSLNQPECDCAHPSVYDVNAYVD